MEFLKSKKFWAACVAVLVPVANELFDLSLTTESVMTIVGPIMAYIVGQGIADTNR